jgi:hypothetical protein
MIKNISLYSDSDLNMYLSGCVVGYRLSSGKVRAYNVNDVCEGEINLEGPNSLRVPCCDPNLVTDWPTLGVVQTGPYVSYVMTDSFDRQYKKSLRQRGMHISVPSMREVRALGVYSDYLSLDNFTSMYNAKDITLEDALAELDGMIARRINRHYFVTWKSGYKNPILGYRDMLVGEIKDGGVSLLPSYQHLAASVGKLTKVNGV